MAKIISDADKKSMRQWSAHKLNLAVDLKLTGKMSLRARTWAVLSPRIEGTQPPKCPCPHKLFSSVHTLLSD